MENGRKVEKVEINPILQILQILQILPELPKTDTKERIFYLDKSRKRGGSTAKHQEIIYND
jgi:hypothetical protein